MADIAFALALAVAAGLIEAVLEVIASIGTRVSAPMRAEKAILTYPKARRIQALVVVCVGFGWLALANAHPEARILGSIGVLTVFGSIAAALEFFCLRIELDSDGITWKSPWRKTVIVGWSEVERIGYNSVARWYFLKTRAGIIIRAPEWLSGLGALAHFALARVPTAGGMPLVRARFEELVEKGLAEAA